jgi:hypothetical protein
VQDCTLISERVAAEKPAAQLAMRPFNSGESHLDFLAAFGRILQF